jgi:hypothetical protein
VELCGATELHAAFREESRTSFLPASAALQEIREAKALFVVFSQGKTTPRDLYQATVVFRLQRKPQLGHDEARGKYGDMI